MIAKGRSTALTYTKEPYLICVSIEPKEELYYVPDSALPALSLGKQCDPMSLITSQELYALKKKYRTPHSLIKRMQECYKKNHDEFDLGDSVSLENRLFIQNVEDTILGKMKGEYRNESANFLPYYPLHELGVRCYHTQTVGASSAGKSYVTAAIIAQNWKKSTNNIYVFSPTATKDKAWTELRKALGRRVKLIDSNKVTVEIPLSELGGGCVLVIDDIDSTQEPSKSFISKLQSRCLFEGRHHTKDGIGCCVFGIVHDAFQIGNIGLKSSNIESSRIICFPNLNKSICTKFWSKRLHWSAKEIRSAFKFIGKNDRYACIYTHVPNLIMTAHGVKLL
jgi:hypothetical protein